MKSLMLLLSTTTLAGVLNAQVTPGIPRFQKQPYSVTTTIKPGYSFHFGDTTTVYFNSGINQPSSNQDNIDNMPVAGLGQVNLTPLGNNHRGFDLYKATPDNMAVAKPDSTFYSSMPNAYVAPAKPWYKH